MIREPYIPVQVIVEDGKVTNAFIDFDGAPWMYVLEEPNVWNPETEEWEGGSGEEGPAREDEETALEWLGNLLKGGGTP